MRGKVGVVYLAAGLFPLAFAFLLAFLLLHLLGLE